MAAGSDALRALMMQPAEFFSAALVAQKDAPKRTASVASEPAAVADSLPADTALPSSSKMRRTGGGRGARSGRSGRGHRDSASAASISSSSTAAASSDAALAIVESPTAASGLGADGLTGAPPIAADRVVAPQVVKDDILQFCGSNISSDPTVAYTCNVGFKSVLHKSLFNRFCGICQEPFYNKHNKIIRSSVKCDGSGCGRWLCLVCIGVLPPATPYTALTDEQRRRTEVGALCPFCVLCADCRLPLDDDPRLARGCTRPVTGCNLWFHRWL